MSKPQIVKATERRILQCQYQINLKEDAPICSHNDSITHAIQAITYMVRTEKRIMVVNVILGINILISLNIQLALYLHSTNLCTER